jgi:glucokinase
MISIGIDIGGTKIALALVDDQGKTLAEHRLTTPANPDQVLDKIAEGIQTLRTDADAVAGVGIGCPGHVDPHSGIVRHAVNLGWTEVYLRDEIARRVNLPVWIEKDTNAATLGELYFGAARGYQDVVYVAVGTGLGGGAVVRGQLVSGANAFAMEIGHLVLTPGGRACRCGLHGCAEMYASGVGLLAGAREAGFPDNVSTADILQAAHQNDPRAQALLSDAAQALAMVFACCASLFNPALIVVGGGLGLATTDTILPQATQTLQTLILPPAYEAMQVVSSQVVHSAVGAAALVWHNYA